MKKQILAVSMAMTMAALAGCSGSGTAATTAAATTAAATTEAATTAAETKAEETQAPEKKEETQAEEKKEASALKGDASKSNWPSGTVQLYVPASAGGGSDMIARLFAKGMADVTGGNFVVINDATGGGTVALETIRNAKTDGLNLYLGHTGQCGMMATGQYGHHYTDFQMLGTITVPGTETNCIVVNKNVAANSLQELIDDAKANPGKYLTGVQANGNRHFMQLLFQKATGTEFTIVDCGGNADTITNLVGGMVDMAILPIVNAKQYVEAGDMKPLAITGDLKSEAMPDVPTMKELGVESCELSSISLLCGPQGMSEDDVAKISECMKQVLENPDIIDQYHQMQMECGYNTPDDAAAIIQEMQEKYDAAAALMQ